MTARDLIILPPGHEGAGFMLTRTERGIALHTGGFGAADHALRTYELEPEQVEQVRVFLAAQPAQPAKPAKPEPLPAWQSLGDGRWMRGQCGSEWADAKPGEDWLAYGSGDSPYPIDQGTAPSVWHAMAAADKALLAAGHTLSDPAPEPPDLSGVTFGAWAEGRYPCGGGAASDEDRRSSHPGGPTAALTVGGCFRIGDAIYHHITTREQADAFLRACGATLEGE